MKFSQLFWKNIFRVLKLRKRNSPSYHIAVPYSSIHKQMFEFIPNQIHFLNCKNFGQNNSNSNFRSLMASCNKMVICYKDVFFSESFIYLAVRWPTNILQLSKRGKSAIRKMHFASQHPLDFPVDDTFKFIPWPFRRLTHNKNSQAQTTRQSPTQIERNVVVVRGGGRTPASHTVIWGWLYTVEVVSESFDLLF